MNKNYLFAGFVVIMMMATVAVPFMASEESDALSGNVNMALSSDRAILYLQGQKGHSATFTASLTDTPYYSQGDIYWRLNNLGDGGDVVSFSDIAGLDSQEKAMSDYEAAEIDSPEALMEKIAKSGGGLPEGFVYDDEMVENEDR